MPDIEFLAIGHVTRDVLGDRWTVGGTAAYAAWTAHRLGKQVAVVTSGDPADIIGQLPGQLIVKPARQTTTFANVYSPTGRTQWVQAVAGPISWPDVPGVLRRAPVVLLGPVIGEIDRGFGIGFKDSLLVATAQGWLRQRRPDGSVKRRSWARGETIVGARAVVLSDEDVTGSEALARLVAGSAPILALTEGSAGVRLFVDGRIESVRGYSVEAANPTGAGDVWAAAFAIRLAETDDPFEAADFGNAAASLLVESRAATIEQRVPDREMIARRRLAAN